MVLLMLDFNVPSQLSDLINANFMGPQDLVKKGSEVLGKCEDMISKLGLFSSNETKDDISTTNLKYLLVIMIILIPLSFS